MTDAITSLTNTGTSSTTKKGENDALAGLAEDFDGFLKLLTTQLKNQDPTDPQDASEFTNQIVAFTEVEQSVNTNDKLDELIALSNKNATDPVSYINKEVLVEGNVTQLSNGRAMIGFSHTEPVRDGTIIIYDTNGQKVFEQKMNNTNGYNQAGYHTYTWDGYGTDGNKYPDGMYEVVVSAVGADGSTAALSTEVSGIVTGVTMTEDEPFLEVGDFFVPLSTVKSVRLPAAKASQS